MPDSAAIDAALSAKLLGDATLMALVPDGVYMDIAGGHATRFVIVSLMSALDTAMFQGRAFESAVYLVKAVEKGTSGLNAKAAAARIDALLEQGTLTITGYVLMSMARTERIRYTEVDQESDARWQHHGGLYSVQVSTR